MSTVSHATHSTEHVPTTTGRTIRWAFAYDFVVRVLTMNREDALRAETIRLAAIEDGASVLDAGCGTGTLTLRAKAAAGSAGKVVGIDAAPEMIAEARRKATRAGVAVDFQTGMIEALAFPDAMFDRVLSSLMMHHLPDDLKVPALAEVHRVLKPGGQLLIVDFDRSERPRGLAAHIHKQAPSTDTPLRSFVERAGFTGIEVGHLQGGSLAFMRGVRPRGC
ncbi:MAG: class I SAM-dependent methyltransferase [Anaerolineales bacterium]|nr:class I SAM-dependent methyltransferase [Anaerolineales bacterium]